MQRLTAKTRTKPASITLRRLTLAALIASSAALGGCGGRFEMGQVSGRVTYRGQPLPEGTVMFVPEVGLGAAGGIRPDGTYRVLTKRPFDGATVGKHKVCVMPPFQPQTAGYPAFDRKYQDAETSGLVFEVKTGENVCNIDLLEEP
jgi:hypothetical protein